MTIHLLEEHLINKIAAGEVIERPASVIKELVDNALDSGATRIQVSFTQGGIEEIEVEDNGHGIDANDLPRAFLRHATSKIAAEDDLYRIMTMGFRGEALPSIASVSRLEIFTCASTDHGMYAYYEGGSLQSLEPVSCPPGTRIKVNDLFFNTPARRKFLKSTVSEGNQIHDLLCRYALARPEVSFTLNSARKTYFKTPGNGSIRDAAIAVFGGEYVKPLLDISYQGSDFQVKGLISPPETTRSNRRSQMLFINQRPIRSSLLYRAIDTAYQGRLLAREHPVIILNLTVPPQLVDVNVHPQKWEVRFADEQQVFSLVRQVIYERLSGHDRSAASGMVPVKTQASRPASHYQSVLAEEMWAVSEPASTAKLPSNSIINNMRLPLSTGMDQDLPLPEMRLLGQLVLAYILVEINGALWIIDQHAAHERILYNRIRQQYHASIQGSQLLFPVSLELSAHQADILESELPRLKEAGFIIDRIGPATVLIREAPAEIHGQESQILFDLLELIDTGDSHDFRNEVMITMACRKAIKSGDFMSASEMQNLIYELLAQDEYQHCPHGRPTIMKIGPKDLERVFKRA